ncbi:MAG: hypothetical protein ACOC6F_00040 [bacterium]
MMLEKGFLATNVFYATYAHQDSHAERHLAAVEETFELLGDATEGSEVERLVKGPVAHSRSQRLT